MANPSKKKKIVLITGAASGLGLAFCDKFYENGYDLVMVDVNEVLLKEASKRYEGTKVVTIVADVRKEEECKGIVKEAVGKCGRIDVFCNNAGVAAGYKEMRRIADYKTDVYKRLMSVNLDGAFFMLRAVLRQMDSQGGGGTIVNTASTAGLRGGIQGNSAYNASKHALVGLTKSAAIEYAARNIRVNAVAPANCHTPMITDLQKQMKDSKLVEQSENLNPIPGLVLPQYVANAVYFLASDESKFITGVTLPIDGGLSAL